MIAAVRLKNLPFLIAHCLNFKCLRIPIYCKVQLLFIPCDEFFQNEKESNSHHSESYSIVGDDVNSENAA